MRKEAWALMAVSWICFTGWGLGVWAQQAGSGEVKGQEAGKKETPALEPVVVTATRTETPVSQLTKSLSVVSAGEMEEAQQQFLPELIDNTPGVFMRRLGGPGSLTSISIRGAGAQHVQYQYNGIPLKDAADTKSAIHYFIEDLYGGSNLGQIEVLRGSNSVLYGSQAMGGVINMVPDKWIKGFGAEIRNEVGAHNTFTENGRLSYGGESFYVDINPMYVRTDGETNGGPFDYYYENRGFTGGAGVKFAEDMTLEFTSLYYDSDVALSQISPSLDAKGNLVKNMAGKDQHREGLLSQYGMVFTHQVSSLWDYTVKGAYGETERHYFWSAVPGNQSNYDGYTTYLETQHNVYFTDWLTLSLGADYDKADYHGQEPRNPNASNYTPVFYDHDWAAWDFFGQGQFRFLDDSLLFDLGGRHNNHEVFDSKTVGEFSAAYIVKPWGTKFHGHVGTGYRTPSLYEVFGGYLSRGNLITIGNSNLKPEESVSYDLGVEQRFMDEKLTLGFTWFRIDFDDLIIYDTAIKKYKNATEAATEGFESYLDLKPCKWFKLGAAYTYADSEYKDNVTGNWLQKEYLPQNKISASATFIPVEGLNATLRLVWQDEKIVPLYDPTFRAVRWEEPSVVTVDASVSYRFLKHYEVWLRAENLLDKEYSEGGFTMPGTWVYAGLKLTF
ncbi:MAG: TonB-dependent receptor [Thermodesulfobacteriota bacterium]